MTRIITESFKINLSILAAVRLYPTKKPTCLYKLECFFLYFILTYPVPLFGIVYLLTEKNFDTFQTNYDAFVTPQTACQIVKLLPFVINGHRIKKCIHYLETSVFAVQDVKHQKILENCSRICRRNTKVYVISVSVSIATFACKPFLEKERRLPLNVWLPFDPTQQTIIYGLVFILVVIGVAHAAIACAAVDPLVGGLACFAAGHFQILKAILQRLEDSAKKSKRTARHELRKCVKYHNEILNFVKEFEKCFSVIAFSQLAGSVIILCFCCLQLSHVQPLTIDFFNLLSYLLIYLTQIYFYCYYGTQLNEESDNINTAVYMSEWYDYDLQLKKDLIRIMEYSKKPVTITVGKILELSLVTFMIILRRSYSLLAVLNNVHIESFDAKSGNKNSSNVS